MSDWISDVMARHIVERKALVRDVLTEFVGYATDLLAREGYNLVEMIGPEDDCAPSPDRDVIRFLLERSRVEFCEKLDIKP